MNALWWGACIIVIALCGIAAYSTVAVGKHIDRRGSEHDTISSAVARHPFLLNPIIMMYFVVGIFMAIVIFYYAAASR
ncbi:short-chain dehydrogenase [Lysinibacillus sp. 3P01SB]|uniref:short-chain dehydrogenase n=1 Tax=Lysinibacillus sp. 3P01SB TaxID=3132284 RepID=UPI0039A5F9B7